eukprot:gene29345-36381_t
MDVLDALDEIKAINQRHERIDTNKLISALHKTTEPPVDDRNVVNKATGVTLADEELIKSIRFKGSSKPVSTEDDGGEEGVSTLKPLVSSTHTISASKSVISSGESTNGEYLSALSKQIKTQTASAVVAPIIIRKKRKVDETPPAVTTSATATSTAATSASVTVASVAPISQPVVATPAVAVTSSIASAGAAAGGGGLLGLLSGYGDSDEE